MVTATPANEDCCFTVTLMVTATPENEDRCFTVKSDITALILAGGRGRRVHGQDKGLMHYQGRALIAWVLERLAPQVESVVISANRHLDQYQAYGWPVIADALADYQGPLAGLCQGLEYSHTRWIMTVPCDGPLLPLDLAQRLASVLDQERASVALAHDGKQAQYGHALVARSLLEDLRSYLTSGERSLGGWLHRHRPIMADFSDIPLAFSNLNHLKDFCAPAVSAETALFTDAEGGKNLSKQILGTKFPSHFA